MVSQKEMVLQNCENVNLRVGSDHSVGLTCGSLRSALPNIFIIILHIREPISQKLFHQNSRISPRRNFGTASDFGCFLGCLGVWQCVNSTSDLTLAECIYVGMVNTLMEKKVALLIPGMQEQNET